jgi:predicted RNase H-like HicB family nuclease
MEIPVLVEPLPGGGFRARSGDPPGLTAEADTPEAALRQLRDRIATITASGAIWTAIDVPVRKFGPHASAGMNDRRPNRSSQV